jgi:hypothetical protein
MIAGDLVGRGNQSPKRATPLNAVIRRTDRKAILVSCEHTTAPVALVLNQSTRLFNDLELE